MAPANSRAGQVVGKRKEARGAASRPVDRQQIVQSAVRLFFERGYHATTMQDIADSVGILKGSLYHHIRSKEEVLVEMLTVSVAEVLVAVKEIAASPGTPRERLRGVIKAETQAMAAHQAEIIIWLTERRTMRDVLSDVDVKAKAADKVILDLLREGARSGEWPAEDSELQLAYHAIRGMLASFPTWYRASGHIGLEAIGERFADFAEAIASAPAPRAA